VQPTTAMSTFPPDGDVSDSNFEEPWVTSPGGAGIDTVSSAQSKHGVTGLEAGETRDGGHRPGTVGVTAGVMAGVGNGWGSSTGVDSIIGDAEAV
jgi:hypothetical protein